MVLRTLNDSLRNVTTFTFVFRVGEIPQRRGTLLSDQRPVRSTERLKESLTVAFPNLCFHITQSHHYKMTSNAEMSWKILFQPPEVHLPYLHGTRHLKTSLFYIIRAKPCVTCTINKYQIHEPRPFMWVFRTCGCFLSEGIWCWTLN